MALVRPRNLSGFSLQDLLRHEFADLKSLEKISLARSMSSIHSYSIEKSVGMIPKINVFALIY